MKKRTLNELRQEKEYGYKPPSEKKVKNNEPKVLQLKLQITDGDKKIKSTINYDDYKATLGLHSLSLADEMIQVLYDKIKVPVIEESTSEENKQTSL